MMRILVSFLIGLIPLTFIFLVEISPKVAVGCVFGLMFFVIAYTCPVWKDH